MLAAPWRFVKKETLKREFNESFFKEIAIDVSGGFKDAWFYDNEQAAQRARLYEHARTAVFKLVLSCKRSQKGELEVDVSFLKPESIKTVTVEGLLPFRYTITNPLLQPNAEIITVSI